MAGNLADPWPWPYEIPKTGRALWKPEGVLRASLTEPEGASIQAVSAQSLAPRKWAELAREEIARAAAAGVNLVTMDDPSYPPRLKEIDQPPLILYLCGGVETLTRSGIAMVGTRHPTLTVQAWQNASPATSPLGLVIISGMARGVDTASHRGAISAKGKTLAVWHRRRRDLPQGKIAPVRADPRPRRRLRIPLGTFAAPQNFPIRNRTLSGMSVGVLVVEAAEYSGTRITARCALEQNRDVFAVPGNVTHKKFLGP